MESQVKVLELENMLEKERLRLSSIRRTHYHLAESLSTEWVLVPRSTLFPSYLPKASQHISHPFHRPNLNSHNRISHLYIVPHFICMSFLLSFLGFTFLLLITLNSTIAIIHLRLPSFASSTICAAGNLFDCASVCLFACLAQLSSALRQMYLFSMCASTASSSLGQETGKSCCFDTWCLPSRECFPQLGWIHLLVCTLGWIDCSSEDHGHGSPLMEHCQNVQCALWERSPSRFLLPNCNNVGNNGSKVKRIEWNPFYWYAWTACQKDK